VIDLHTHSSCSDGSETPEQVVELAAAAGCATIALTDHDSTDGIDRAASRAAQLGIALVPGCEVSCSFSPGTMHVLCYFVSAAPSPLQDELARLRHDRETRNEKMVERLRAIGLPVTYAEVLEEAGGVGLGRPHVAAVLVRHGVVGSVQEAFDTYLAKGAPGYVSKTRVDAGTVVDVVTRSGAVAVLAHPLSLGLDPPALEHELRRLREIGLVGVECYYGRYEPSVREELVSLAARTDLVATGGSDFHGRYKPDLSAGSGTGDLDVPDSVVDELAGRRTSSGGAGGRVA
jgi:predicted metal-dependent phosphoesterase TrpH